MKNYQITIGYRAIITVDVKCKDEQEAKEEGKKIFENEKQKMFKKNNISLQDDNYDAYGVLNMTKTWDML